MKFAKIIFKTVILTKLCNTKSVDCCRLTGLFTFFHDLILFKELWVEPITFTFSVSYICSSTYLSVLVFCFIFVKGLILRYIFCEQWIWQFEIVAIFVIVDLNAVSYIMFRHVCSLCAYQIQCSWLQFCLRLDHNHFIPQPLYLMITYRSFATSVTTQNLWFFRRNV